VRLIRVTPGADPVAVAGALAGPAAPGRVGMLTKSEFGRSREGLYWRSSTAIGFIFTFGAGMGFVVGLRCRLSESSTRATSATTCRVRHLDGDGLSAPFPAGWCPGRPAAGDVGYLPALAWSQGSIPWCVPPPNCRSR